jgi:leader peptidase (prepilin peptidase)/N-methyltransferase
VLSWLVLRGRCVTCDAPISARYPVTELASAGLFTIAAMAYGASWSVVTACALALGLVIIVLSDLDKEIIPDLVLLWLLPAGLIHRWLVGAEWSDTAAGAVIALAFGLSLRWLAGRWARREALGLGDVKLLGVAGAWLGIAALPWFLMAAGALGAGFAALWRWRHGHDGFPLGPALSLALFACVLAQAPW